MDAGADYLPLNGFRFECRPGCGLCCFATPAVSPGEAHRLLQIEPLIPLLSGEGEYSFLAARPEGGACHLLSDSRCRAHGARPFPCREFPLTVHVGDRVQFALVLSCPGLDLGVLSRDDDSRLDPPAGLESELQSVTEELSHWPVDRWLRESARRRRTLEKSLARQGYWERPWEELAGELGDQLRLPPQTAFPPNPPPPDDAPVEALPLFHDPEFGPVAFREHSGGWEAIALRETGGIARHLGVFPELTRAPRLDRLAEAMLIRYLRYVLQRDQFYWSLLEEYAVGESENETIAESARSRLEEIGAQVLTRADIQRRIHGLPAEELSTDDVERGIRSIDAELLDVPTLGRVL